MTPDDKPDVTGHSRDSLLDDVGKIGHVAVQRASPVAIGTALVVMAIIVSFGTFLYFNKDTVIRMMEVTYKVDHLQESHDHCHTALEALQIRIRNSEEEISKLKEHLRTNPIK